MVIIQKIIIENLFLLRQFQKLRLVTLLEGQIEPGEEHIEKEINQTTRKLNELKTIQQFSDKDGLAVFLGVKEPKGDEYV